MILKCTGKNEYENIPKVISEWEDNQYFPFSLYTIFFAFQIFDRYFITFKSEKKKKKLLNLKMKCYATFRIPTPYDHWGSLPGDTVSCLSPILWDPDSIWGHERKFLSEDKERQCSLGIPDTSFSGLSTRTARRVLRSTCVLKWVPAVARMLQRETQRIEVTRAGLSSPVPWGGGGSWVKEESTWKEHLTSIRVTHLSHHFGILVPNHR